MRWAVVAVAMLCLVPFSLKRKTQAVATGITIRADQPPLNTFRPDRVWGAALDGHDYSRTATVYSPENIAAMQSARLGAITYRLRSELAVEAWHWNPAGRWSDSTHQQGYWTSSAATSSPIEISYGYRLPRRGRTVDDANNDGYSRIDDGDSASFWKTNPYLDPVFTHDGPQDHPQWLVVDLGKADSVSTMRLLWGTPYPRRYLIDYWTGDQSLPIDRNPDGEWRRFTGGSIAGSRGGDVTLRLETRPLLTRFVRITLFESSHTAPAGNVDRRDALGFALRELYLGTVDGKGVFHDAVRHANSPTGQSEILVSSTDPWHRAVDRDSNVAQPGFDRVFQSGLTRGRPMLVPTGLLFDTPENAAAELRYLRARGYAVERMELGEEPDGQRVTPEDYGSLYLQFGAALRRVDSTITLGGPSFQTLYNDELRLWPARTAPGKRSTWIGRFVDYLDARRALGEFGFFSFEWYPFDDVCGPPAPHLAEAPAKLSGAIDRLRAAGLPPGIPFVITEYGYSAHASPVEIDLPGAIFNVETVANFFAHRGSAAYAFGFEPAELMHEPGCPNWGNLAFFLSDPAGQVRDSMPAYWAARLLTTVWADSLGGEHRQYSAQVDREAGAVASPVGAYALHRPDGRWSVLVVNRDPTRPRGVRLSLRSGDPSTRRALAGPLDIWQYSGDEYQFHADGENGRPARNLPPTHRRTPDPLAPIVVPPMSITVIVGH